jgi:hypothetical protein
LFPRRLLPRLSARATRNCLIRILTTVYGKREQQPFIDAKVVFQHVLEYGASKLAFRATDFETYGMYNFNRNPNSYSDDFVSLIDKSLRLGLLDSLSPTLEESRISLENSTPVSGREAAVTRLLQSTAIKLQEHGISPTPTLKAFFETFLRNGVLTKKPTYPTRRHLGWGYRPHGCGGSTCKDCAALDAFLRSETERIGRFQMGKERRNHLHHRLPAALFDTKTEIRVSPHTLVVTKAREEFESDLLSYKSEVQALETRVSPLKGEYMKKLLGDSAYRKLILLDDIKFQGSGTPATGQKRTIECSVDEGRGRQKRKL